MRYRSAGKSATVVSALSLGLCEDGLKRGPTDWTNLIFAALENGINCFEVLVPNLAMAEGIARALTAVERELLFFGWRVGRVGANQHPVRSFSSQAIQTQIRAALARTGLGYLDLLMLDEPSASEVGEDGLRALAEAKDAGEARMLGVAGHDESVDAFMRCGVFDVLGTTFNLTSGWKERNWLRTASKHDMAVIGYEPYPIEFHRAVAAALRDEGKAKMKCQPLHGCGSYMFLDSTPGWTAEEICLAHALTEPSLATVQILAPAIDRLERLAETPEREMPPGLSAQIEMARFAPMPAVEPERRRA